MNNTTPAARSGERGFTLPELVIAVTVIAILTSLAIAGMRSAMRSSREARAIGNIKALASTEMMVYDARFRFASFNDLFAEGYLTTGQFSRGHPEGGPIGAASEAISDETYLYTVRFSDSASGVTIDADPIRSLAGSYRRFRIRLGRITQARRGGSESVVYYAAPSVTSPPTAAYRPLAQ